MEPAGPEPRIPRRRQAVFCTICRSEDRGSPHKQNLAAICKPLPRAIRELPLHPDFVGKILKPQQEIRMISLESNTFHKYPSPKRRGFSVLRVWRVAIYLSGSGLILPSRSNPGTRCPGHFHPGAGRSSWQATGNDACSTTATRQNPDNPGSSDPAFHPVYPASHSHLP